MGFFSWKTSDTGRSISNVYSDRKCFPVYVLIPEPFEDKYGKYIKETAYEGYGCFGGHDVYALFAEWNAPDECVGIDEKDRQIGIEIEFGDKPIKYPIKITEYPCDYENVRRSERDKYQGYFYD